MTELYLWIGGFLAVIFALLGFGARQKAKGREEADNAALRDTFDRLEKGRDALRSNRDGTPDERVRRNDDKW